MRHFAHGGADAERSTLPVRWAADSPLLIRPRTKQSTFWPMCGAGCCTSAATWPAGMATPSSGVFCSICSGTARWISPPLLQKQTWPTRVVVFSVLYPVFRTRHIGDWGAALLTFPLSAQWTDDDLDHYLVMLRILLMPQAHDTKEGAARVVAGPAYVSGRRELLVAQAAT